MIPFLIDKDFDLVKLYESGNLPVYDADNKQVYVFDPNPSTPETNGIGVLAEASECIAKCVLNGEDEISLKYPVDGELYDKIELRAIIIAKVDRVRGNQPYRIYRITKPIKGHITIYARHIVYDLEGVVVKPFKATNISDALAKLKNNAVCSCPFTFATSKIMVRDFEVKEPKSIWDLLGTKDGGLLDVYGGEYKFDGFGFLLADHIGHDRGVSVRYGVNMTDFEQDANCANCYTGVIAFWRKESEIENKIVYSNVVSAFGTYQYNKIKVLDFSSDFTEAPTMQELTSLANEYIVTNQIGVPEVSWKINFVPLDQTEEYKDIAALEEVSLGDTVKVIFEKLDVNATSQVVSITWDVLSDRYKEIELGSVKNNLASTISSQNKEISSFTTTDEVTSMIYNLSGGLVSDWIKTHKISADQIEGGALTLGKELNEAGIIRIYDEQNAFIGSMYNSGMWWGKNAYSSLQNQDGFTIRKKVGEDIKRLVLVGRSAEDANGTVYGLIQVSSVDSEGNTVIRAYVNGNGSFHAHSLQIYDFDENDERVNNAIITKDGIAYFKRLFVNGHEIT